MKFMDKLLDKITGRSCRKARLTYEESVATLRTSVEKLSETTRKTQDPEAAKRAITKLRDARILQEKHRV